MKHIDWDNVQEATDFKPLPAGAYICGILRAEDVPEKEYLRFEWDIAEGEFKNYYRQRAEHNPDWKWGGVLCRSYKENALKFFKAFLTAVKASNPGFVFDDDERVFVRKKVGLVLGEEEYEKRDGSTGTRLYVAQVRSVAAIREGDFKVPPKKLLTPSADAQNNAFVQVSDDDDLPF